MAEWLAGVEPEDPQGPSIRRRLRGVGTEGAVDETPTDLRNQFRELLPDPRIPAQGIELAGYVRDYLDQGEALVREIAAAGASGSEIVHNRAWMMDYLVARLYTIAIARTARRYTSVRTDVAMVALGGYGRGELCPGSDVDLMLLYSWRITPAVEFLCETIYLALNDARLKVGFSTRSVSDCVEMALTDRTTRTALLDHRYIAGSRALFEELENTLVARVVTRGTAGFIRETLEWAEERRSKYGETVYLLEPNVKEGRGGLRDLHTATWVAKVWFKVHDRRQLVTKGILKPAEIANVEDLEDFLWRARSAIHILSGKGADRLTFELQSAVAEFLGYRDGDGQRAVERFMRDYYRTGGEVQRFAGKLIALCQDRGGASSRILGYFTRRNVGDGFQIYLGELKLAEGTGLQARPAGIVRAFDLIQRHGVPLAQATEEAITAGSETLEDDALADPEVAEIFLGILTAKRAVRETVLEMHRLGVLDRLLPEFRHLHYLVQHDLFHAYTVDVHAIQCLGEMEKLLRGDLAEELPTLTEVARHVREPLVALLGAFFHDIGKGLGGRHSERGAKMSRAITDRMGLAPESRDLVEFLVREHLVMPLLAFRRDMHDPYVIHTLAKKVRTRERLDLLYLVTAADIRAVSPSAWNAWKAGLLEELYRLTLEAIEGDSTSSEVTRKRLTESRAALLEELREAGFIGDAEAFVHSMPDLYLLWVRPQDALMHVRLILSLQEGRTAVTHVEHQFEAEFSTVTVVTRDAPGVFSKIAGVLATNNLNILSAHANTLAGGLVVDVFHVAHHLPRVDFERLERWARLEKDLELVLADKSTVRDLIEARQTSIASPKRPIGIKVPTEVDFDNDASQSYTVLEVFTLDRLGLLHTITKAMFEQGLDLHLAKIVTQGKRAADAFYVTDASGAKITSAPRLAEIRGAIFEALGLPRPAVDVEGAGEGESAC
ncbi:MAG: [protein-PII] uridylyltransferase [Myxococcales bacterium]|nr:[protein-PII] uridylyltransferase [Myxococcales bacterium]